MGRLRKIECVGKSERHEVAGKTSKVLDAFVEKLFHLAWDVDRLPYRFHKQSLSRPIDFVKKLRVPTRAARKAARRPCRLSEIRCIPSASPLSANHLTAKIIVFVSLDQERFTRGVLLGGVLARRVSVSAFCRNRVALQRKKCCQQIIGLDDESFSIAGVRSN